MTRGVDVSCRAAYSIHRHSRFLVKREMHRTTRGVGVLCRAAYNIHRRSRALAHLPGPKYPWLLGDMAFLARKDLHRAATELAERYGPLVKIRVMCFHVPAPASP